MTVRVYLRSPVAIAWTLLGAVAVGTSYTYPTHSANIVAQTGQPGSDLRPTVDRIDRADRRIPRSGVISESHFAGEFRYIF